jgi:germination protein M
MARLRFLALALPLALAACGGSGGGSTSTATPTEPLPPPPPPSTATETTAAPISLRLFFLKDGKVAVARRDVPATQQVATAALNALFEGPNAEERNDGLTTAVPSGTALESLTIDQGVARVALNRRLAGAAAAQVIYTLEQFPTVHSVSGVQADLERYTPAILIESPAVGDSVTSPLRVSGTANTFEATFTLELRTGGRLLGRKTVTATSGSGTRGTFETEFRYSISEETPGELVAYELSAENGARINTVTVPIGLLP